MDDFIADDDEPILISSDEEEQEADEVFYYQCDNAEAFPDSEEVKYEKTVALSKGLVIENMSHPGYWIMLSFHTC